MEKLNFTWEMGVRLAVIAIVTFVLLRVVKWMMDPFIKKSSSYLKIDSTRYRFFRNALNTIIVATGIILAIHTIPALRALSMTLFASAGILAAAFAFASQQALSNIISGIFVVTSKPFRVGDTISVGAPGQEYFGVVEDITLRHTVIKDVENARIIIPNSIINMQTLINYNIIDPRCRKRILIKVSPLADLKAAITVIQEEIFAHPDFVKGDNVHGPSDVDVQMTDITERAVTLRAYAWTENLEKAFELEFDVKRDILIRFRLSGIEISDTRLA